MDILMIEDRPVDGRTLRQVAARFGEVRWARSLGEARAELAAGFVPAIIITDMHLPDGPDGAFETFAVVERLADEVSTRLVAMTSDVTADFRREFAQRFPSFKLIEKPGLRALQAYLESMRLDESERPVPTLDSGSPLSHETIETWWRQKLRALKVPDEPYDYWLQKQIEGRVKCLGWRERLMVGVGMALAVAVALALGGDLWGVVREWIGRQ